MDSKPYRAIAWGGALLAALSLTLLVLIDLPLRGGTPVRIEAAGEAALSGTLWRGAGGPEARGALLLPGFGSERTAMRPLARELVKAGWSVLAFDFPGHGRSPGSLGYDNARTDRLARAVLAAASLLSREAGLSNPEISLVGHSLGARVALEAAVAAKEPFRSLALLGAQVNLAPNLQASVFTGTADTDLAWVQALGPGEPDCPVLLVSGTWDDILTPEGAALLHEKLGGTGTVPERRRLVLPALLHNYEPWSARAAAAALGFLGIGAAPSAARPALWIAALAGLWAAFAGGAAFLAARRPGSVDGSGSAGRGAVGAAPAEIAGLGRFVLAKYLLWLPALPFAALLGGLLFLVPIPKPVMNFYYVGFIGGYGLLQALLWRLGKMPGARGRSPFPPAGKAGFAAPPATWLLAAAAFAATAILGESGLGRVPPSGPRLFWLFAFTPFTALGFLYGEAEAALARGAGAGPTLRRALALAGFVPFLLYAAAMGALGSLSGLTGAVQGLAVLGLALALGRLLRAAGAGAAAAALAQALFLYWLVLPQGALFP